MNATVAFGWGGGGGGGGVCHYCIICTYYYIISRFCSSMYYLHVQVGGASWRYFESMDSFILCQVCSEQWGITRLNFVKDELRMVYGDNPIMPQSQFQTSCVVELGDVKDSG